MAKNGSDVAEIGDGVENDNHDSQATDGWTHDSVNPGNYYFEGELDEAVEANYIRILFTAGLVIVSLPSMNL